MYLKHGILKKAAAWAQSLILKKYENFTLGAKMC